MLMQMTIYCFQTGAEIITATPNNEQNTIHLHKGCEKTLYRIAREKKKPGLEQPIVDRSQKVSATRASFGPNTINKVRLTNLTRLKHLTKSLLLLCIDKIFAQLIIL